MGDPTQDRAKAATLPEGDVIRLLLEQHARIRELFTEVKQATGKEKKEAFDDLRSLLAVHETAEELVLRPVTSKVVSDSVAQARNHEEAEANKVLERLERLDAEDPAFDSQLVDFESSVDQHAESEEHEEFDQIIANCDEQERQKMGTKIRAAEAAAPTRPHPSVEPSSTKQRVVGPFAGLVDRVKDAITGAGS